MQLTARASCLGGIHARVEGKVLIRGGSRRLRAGGTIEGNATQQQSPERFHLHIDATGAELDRYTRSIPERRIVVHIPIKRRAYEGVDSDAVGQIAEVPAEHRANVEVAVEDWRAQADRAQPLGLQNEGGSWSGDLEDGRVLAADEAPLRLAFLR